MASLGSGEIEQMREVFSQFDLDGNGSITTSELGKVMEQLGEKVPGYKLRSMIEEVDKDQSGTVEFDEFVHMIEKVRSGKDSSFHKIVQKVEKVNKLGGSTDKSAAGTTHSYSEEEKVAFVDWINHSLEGDPQIADRLPISEEGDALFVAFGDGILLAKLINSSVPETIDERAINMSKLNAFKIQENLTLCINSAKAIGCNIVNLGGQDIVDGNPTLVLGLIWQIIRIGLFAQINLQQCPGLARLLEGDETLTDLMGLPADMILLRWVNFHLREAGSSRRIHNFSNDIKDSEAYTILLKQICPPDIHGVDMAPMREQDHFKRAEMMLQNADKMYCRKFVRPGDVVAGNPKLNLAFVANLFNTHPHLEMTEELKEMFNDFDMEDNGETREERTFRNWMNSLGVAPYVNNLYQDLRDGLVLIQLFDKVNPGKVDWKRVSQPPWKPLFANMKKLENCNYAVELAKDFNFSVVGIGGPNINEGHRMLTLAIVWQLMRAYTLSVLQKIGGGKEIKDSDIVDWANQKLKAAGKSSSFTGFKDDSLCTGLALIDLVDAIRPGSIDYANVIANPATQEEYLKNCKYGVSMGRRIGANIYALPEDVAEVKPKMTLTVFACLMTVGFKA